VEPVAVVADPGMDMVAATTGEEEEVAVEDAVPISCGAFAALSGAAEIVRTLMHAAMRIGGCRVV